MFSFSPTVDVVQRISAVHNSFPLNKIKFSSKTNFSPDYMWINLLFQAGRYLQRLLNHSAVPQQNSTNFPIFAVYHVACASVSFTDSFSFDILEWLLIDFVQLPCCCGSLSDEWRNEIIHCRGPWIKQMNGPKFCVRLSHHGCEMEIVSTVDNFIIITNNVEVEKHGSIGRKIERHTTQQQQTNESTST